MQKAQTVLFLLAICPQIEPIARYQDAKENQILEFEFDTFPTVCEKSNLTHTNWCLKGHCH